MVLEISAALLDHFGWHRGEGVSLDDEPAVSPFAAFLDADVVVLAGVFLWEPNNLLAPVGMSKFALNVHLGSHCNLLSTSGQMVGRAGLEPATLSDGIYSPTA